MARLLEVGCALITERDPEVLFDHLLRTAREMTGAGGAMRRSGTPTEQRTEFERFLAVGMDESRTTALDRQSSRVGVECSGC